MERMVKSFHPGIHCIGASNCSGMAYQKVYEKALRIILLSRPSVFSPEKGLSLEALSKKIIQLPQQKLIKNASYHFLIKELIKNSFDNLPSLILNRNQDRVPFSLQAGLHGCDWSRR